MATHNRIDPPNNDAQQRLRLLHLLVEVVGTQSELARLIGVQHSTVSQWLSGKREPEEWHVVLAAIRATIARRPSDASRLVEFFAETIFGIAGRWIPDPGPGEVGEHLEEQASLTLAQGQLTSAVRLRDPTAVRAASREVVCRAHRVAVAAGRSAA